MLYRIRVHVLPTIQCFLWGKNPRNDHIKEELAINRGMEHPPSFWGGNLVVGVAPISAVFKPSFLIALIVVGSISVGRFWDNLSLLCQSFAP